MVLLLSIIIQSVFYILQLQESLLFKHNYDSKMNHYQKVKAKLKSFRDILKFIVGKEKSK